MAIATTGSTAGSLFILRPTDGLSLGIFIMTCALAITSWGYVIISLIFSERQCGG
jgi:hypothetical protein